MAIMEFSQALMNAAVPKMFSPNGSSSSSQSEVTAAACSFFPYAPSSTYPNTVTGIHIMKGTPPTNFAGLTSFSVRSADRLVSFLGTDTFAGSGTTSNKFTLSTTNKAAVASGTATWFWAIGTSSVGTSTSTIWQQFIGNVGVTGSGADLEISDINIVTGEVYRATALTIIMPSTFVV